MTFRKTLTAIALSLVLSAVSGCDSAKERAEKFYQSGLSYLEAGDIDRALVEFRNVFKLDGQHHDARLAYADALRVLARDFCLAARAAGKTRFRIGVDHVLPNIAGGLAVQATLQIGLAILIEAGLSFLGLGVRPPEPSWGRMLSEAQTYLAQAPWMTLAPGVTICLAVLGLNLLGDSLRDWFDPRSEAGR